MKIALKYPLRQPVKGFVLSKIQSLINSVFSDEENGTAVTSLTDLVDKGRVWQDSDGTIPAADGDLVGRVDDLSGNKNHLVQSSSDNRPTLRKDGDGWWYLEFDGSNKYVLWATGTDLINNHTFVAVVRPTNSSNTDNVFCDFSNNGSGSSDSRWYLNDSTGEQIRHRRAGTNINEGDSGLGSQQGVLQVVSGKCEPGAQSARRDGIEVLTGTNPDTPSSALVEGSIGAARSGLDQHGAFDLYGFVAVKKQLSTEKIADVEQYMADKAGLSL